MSTVLWKLLRTAPLALGTSLLIAPGAGANVALETETNSALDFDASTLAQALPETSATELMQQINRYSNDAGSFDQVTNVNQLRDVSPGDWAYEALRNLVETYGCIAGYPDGTYRGNRAMTRYEFAAGLNACLQQIERLIAASTADFVTKDDLVVLQRLLGEFEAELATLGTRVDNLEGRVAFLEDHQFSTTTKLKGEVIFSLNSAFGDERADGSDDDIDNQVTFADRVRLAFDTSFTGKDRLRTRLQAGNIPRLDDATGTDMARLGFDANNGNNIVLDTLHYRFPIGSNIRGHLATAGFDFNDVANVYNPFFASSGTGGLSRFGRRNPAIFRNSADAGAGLNIGFSDNISLDVAYVSDNTESPADGAGIFNGEYTAVGQLNFEAGGFGLGLAGGYSYFPGDRVSLSGSAGSVIAEDPFGDVATGALRLGAQTSWRVAPWLNVGGWVGYVNAELLDDVDIDGDGDDDDGSNADIWNWAAHIAFPDFLAEGNVLGFIVGMPPKATEVDNADDDDDTSILVEAQYKWKVTRNIQVTPGVYVIFNPEHNNDNDTIYVGTIRTTFKF